MCVAVGGANDTRVAGVTSGEDSKSEFSFSLSSSLMFLSSRSRRDVEGRSLDKRARDRSSGNEEGSGVSCSTKSSDIKRLESDPIAETTGPLDLLLRKDIPLPLEGETDLPLSLEGGRDHHLLGTPFGGVVSPWRSSRWCGK
jgi:hypothetical protein